MKPIQIIPILLICLVFFAFEPNDYYYHPWLEYPYYKPEMQGPLPPNTGTDDYEVIFHATGPNPESMLGFSLCLAGDQNNDGYDDIFAYCDDPPEVRLYYGGDPMDTIPDMTFPMQPGEWTGLFPLELADLNGDGGIDLVVEWEPNFWYSEVYAYYGGELLDNEIDLVLKCDEGVSPTGFGYGMSCGDINGDDYYDLVIGAPNYIISGGGGKIFIYYGGTDFDSIPDFTMTSAYNDFGGVFGGYVSASGDVNNDGIDDMISIWAKTDSTGVMLFLGNTNLDSIPDWIYSLPYYPGGYNVHSGTIIKDLNNDGYDEIAVITMHGYGFETQIIFGSDIIGYSPDLIIPGGGDGPRKCTFAGDVNADGFNDLIFGNSDNDWVRVYFGGDPMNAVVDLSYYLPDAGLDVDFAGDVNNDGLHEFMFNAYWHSVFVPWPGEIFIYSDPSLTPHFEPRYNDNPPTVFTLNQNFPNPFNGVTVIPFQSNINGRVELNIYNILGQTVYFNSFDCTFGENIRVLWDGKDISGNVLPSGLYFAELIAENYREAIKMEILR